MSFSVSAPANCIALTSRDVLLYQLIMKRFIVTRSSALDRVWADFRITSPTPVYCNSSHTEATMEMKAA
jgi:hypothetical protein